MLKDKFNEQINSNSHYLCSHSIAHDRRFDLFGVPSVDVETRVVADPRRLAAPHAANTIAAYRLRLGRSDVLRSANLSSNPDAPLQRAPI